MYALTIYYVLSILTVAAGAPEKLNLDEITKDSATLSWSKPKNDGGSKLEGYVIEKKKPGEDWVECMEVPAHQTQAKVPNLKEGEDYQFRVKAVNSLGPGEPSKPTDVKKAEDQPCKMILLICIVALPFFNPFPNNKFQTLSNSGSLQTTVISLMKMTKFSNMVENNVGKEEMLVTSNFSLSSSVFKRIIKQIRKNKGLFGKGLKALQSLITCMKLFSYL